MIVDMAEDKSEVEAGQFIGLPPDQLQEIENDEQYQDHTINMCDYCVKLHIRQVPPKRPLSPFIFFSQEQRKVLKLINQMWSTKQVMNHLKKTWRNMSEKQTRRYREMSEIDRNRYDRQRKLQKEGITPDQTCTCHELKLLREQ